MRNRRHRYNIHGLILCGLVFFVIAATAFCMVANSKEAEREQKRIEAEKKLAAEKKEEEAKAEAARKEAERAASFAVQPGVPAGTLEADMNRKVVYLTFDDGPSENTGKILDILKQYGVKATFFITGSNAEQRSFINRHTRRGIRSGCIHIRMITRKSMHQRKRILRIWKKSGRSRRNRSDMCRVLSVFRAVHRMWFPPNIKKG